MEPFRGAQAAGSDWRVVCRRCIEQLADLSPDANLGFVYASDPLSAALDLIVAQLQKATGVAAWVGTGGARVCGTGREHDEGGALAILVGTLPERSFRLFDGLHQIDGAADPSALAVRPADGAWFGIVHGDPRQPQIPDAIARLADDDGVFLVGGLCSAKDAGVQIAGAPTEGGLSGVLLDRRVSMVTGLSQACTPIGPAHEVTASRGSWLTGLDGRPALDVLREEIGEVLARQPSRIGGFIHAALPVAGSDRFDYLVRNLLGIDTANGALALGTSLRRGERLIFVKRDEPAARDDLQRMLDDVRARTEGRPVRGALYHACVARGANMFGPGSIELKMIEDTLGPVPLAGFFGEGEIFRDRLYAYTGVLTLFL